MANDNLYNLSKGEHNIYVYQLDIFVYLHIYVLKVKFYIYLCISVCIRVWHLVLILFFKEECMVKSKYSSNFISSTVSVLLSYRNSLFHICNFSINLKLFRNESLLKMQNKE